jgi:hypothetical protein
MKAYGLIRRMYIKYMDKQDCLEIGTKSKHMKLKSKNRATTRQIWKGKARMKNKKELLNEL